MGVKQDGIGRTCAIVRDSRCVVSEPMRRGRGRPPLPVLQLTAPEVVTITPDQYGQAVDLLATMILRYHHAQHSRAELAGHQSPAAG
jgi:hypothetical protein